MATIPERVAFAQTVNARPATTACRRYWLRPRAVVLLPALALLLLTTSGPVRPIGPSAFLTPAPALLADGGGPPAPPPCGGGAGLPC